MNSLDSKHTQQTSLTHTSCLLTPEIQHFEPQAEDILTDEDLLDLFRIVKQVLRKNPDAEKLAKLLFCMSYALGDHIKFSKPCHENRIVFRDNRLAVHSVFLPSSSSCCESSIPSFNQQEHRSSSAYSHSYSELLKPEKDSVQKWIDSSSVTSTHSPTPISPLTRLPSVSYLTNIQNHTSKSSPTPNTLLSEITNENTSTETYPDRSYTDFRSLYSTSDNKNNTTSTVSNVVITSLPLANGALTSIPSPTVVQSPHLQQTPEDSTLGIEGPDRIVPTTIEPHRYVSTINSPTQHITKPVAPSSEVVTEPQQRGFYYQDGRITREPVLLQRYAEQGILTQASLMRKRKRHSVDTNSLHESSSLPASTKKPKIPHRHGEFEHRRDDIISRLRSITMADLEQKAQRLPQQFTLAIDQSVTSAEEALSTTVANGALSQKQLAELLEPALRILTNHSNMKPHLDNGMNQNGIYYNSDYFRLYLAFEQFQRTFAILFPNEVVKDSEGTSSDSGGLTINTSAVSSTGTTEAATERDKDRERNANMKAYRAWIEPLLTETNWAAFRRNIVVGERMMQLTKSVGQGMLLMTKELSGSKLHLTFTNSEWDDFINGLISGKWDETIEWERSHRNQLLQQQQKNNSLLVSELRFKFATHYWFYPEGLMVSPKDRRMAIHASTVANNNNTFLHRNSVDSDLL